MPPVRLADATGAPLKLHPDDTMLWQVVHPDRTFDALSDGDVITVGGSEVQVLHTPGHSPGGVCLYVPDLGVLFSGDTLFHGGPGATGQVVQPLPDNPGLDKRAPPDPAPGDQGPDRPRRRDNNRGRGNGLRGLGSPRPLDVVSGYTDYGTVCTYTAH